MSFLGLAGVAWLSMAVELPESQLSEARCEAGETVRVEAMVADVKGRGNITILSLAETCGLTAVAFERLDVEAGDRVEVVGVMERYEGEPELVVDRLAKVG